MFELSFSTFAKHKKAVIANKAVCKRAKAGNSANDNQRFDNEGKTSTLPKAKRLFRNE